MGKSENRATLTHSTCGYSNAGPDAPNGAEEWLNCGITSGGWTPPHLGLDNLKVESLHADGVFAPCAPYFWAFEQYGNAHGSEYPKSVSCTLLTRSSPHSTRFFRHARVHLQPLGHWW